MATTNSIFIVLSCLAVFIQSQSDDGQDNWCEKNGIRFFSNRLYPTECCKNQQNCNTWIGPNENKLGLTNSDPQFSKRLCNCDLDFYNCVSSNLTVVDRARVRRVLGKETCFRRKSPQLNNAEEFIPLEYEFVSFRDVLLKPDVETKNLDLSLFDFKPT